MLAVTGGVNTHRGALWALGLLSCGRRAPSATLTAPSTLPPRLAAIPDPTLTADATSHGAQARQALRCVAARRVRRRPGFPHVRLPCPARPAGARRSGADEGSARLDALLALMAHLDDTCVLHRGGPEGLRALQSRRAGRAGRRRDRHTGRAGDTSPHSTTCA